MIKKFSIMVALALVTFSCTQASKPSAETEDAVANSNLNVEQFEAMVNAGKGLLLDVRTPEEFQTGHLPGANPVNVLEEGFKTEVDKMDRNVPVLVYCKSGGRSTKAMTILKEMGFKEVYNLKGGITAWRAKNKWIEE